LKHHNADMVETRMKFVILFTLIIVAGCSLRSTLGQLEDDAIITGDWAAVERREELDKEWLEASDPGCLPGCLPGLTKVCIEEPSGIQCYCIPSADHY
jgi:hypothetical protein